GPPMPWKRTFGSCGRRPAMRRAASMSPDTSPATIASETPGSKPAGSAPPGCETSADDATGGGAEEFAHGADVCRRGALVGFELQQRGLGFFEGQVGAVYQLVGAADAVDLLARETAALQAFDIHAALAGR